jgi:hypothetical protein
MAAIIADTSALFAGMTESHPLAGAIRGQLDEAAQPPVVSPMVLAHRFDTSTMLTLDERHFRTLVPLSDARGAFRLFAADR